MIRTETVQTTTWWVTTKHRGEQEFEAPESAAREELSEWVRSAGEGSLAGYLLDRGIDDEFAVKVAELREWLKVQKADRE